MSDADRRAAVMDAIAMPMDAVRDGDKDIIAYLEVACWLSSTSVRPHRRPAHVAQV